MGISLRSLNNAIFIIFIIRTDYIISHFVSQEHFNKAPSLNTAGPFPKLKLEHCCAVFSKDDLQTHSGGT